MSRAPIESRFARLSEAAYALPEDLAARVLSPALVVHLDRVRENLGRVLAAMGDDADRWRPHIKTIKIPLVMAALVRCGVRYFKCATTREAGCLLRVLDAEHVADGDLLVAYPHTGPNLARLGALAERHRRTRVSVLCEQPDSVGEIPESLEIFVDVNPGMNRTGLAPDRYEEIVQIARLAGRRFRGVHCYDGHLLGVETAERRRRAFECYDRLMVLVERLMRDGVGIEEIITSGTPTFRHAMDYPHFGVLRSARHRVSPGTVVFHDLRSEQMIAELDLVPAALVYARVVSRPAEGVVTCDAGSKSIAAESGNPCAYVLGHPELVPMTPSEEHLPLRVIHGPPPRRGTGLYLIPRHVCPTINLAEEVIVLERGKTKDVVTVSARAHELLAGAPDDDPQAKPGDEGRIST